MQQHLEGIRRPWLFAAVLVAVGLAPAPARAQQEIETETARPLPNGVVEAGGGVEVQTSSEGREVATPIAVELGLLNRFELLVEPVPVTWIDSADGPGAVGLGDLEVTVFGLAWKERKVLPAVALGLELKVPTATDPLIGTRKTDLAIYLIGSKRLGPVDFHVNGGYTVVGRPDGIDQVVNVWSGALAGILPIGTHPEVFAEVYGSTSAVPGGDVPETPGTGEVVLTPELATGELVAGGGMAWNFTPDFSLSLGVSVDNRAAVLVRPGIVGRFKAF